MSRPLDIVILGLSITSSWGNGHATTFRGLLRELAARGHHVTFLERDVPWYAANRDLPDPSYCTTFLYRDREQLEREHGGRVAGADAVIVGSYVPEGIAVAEWVVRTAKGIRAFYDIDTPATLASLARNDCEYLTADLIPRFDLYLSFAGGPTLERLEKLFGAVRARPLYCAVDPKLYFPEAIDGVRWDLGYMGTYSDDRQPPLDCLLLEAARRRPERYFCVAGPQYPAHLLWPKNVERIEHLPPAEHRAFYNAQSYTLNITRADMVRMGWSPSVRLFEAAACGTPIISDWWEGMDAFFTPGEEILIAHSPSDTLLYIDQFCQAERRRVGERARQKVLTAHTAAHRAAELESYLTE